MVANFLIAMLLFFLAFALVATGGAYKLLKGIKKSPSLGDAQPRGSLSGAGVSGAPEGDSFGVASNDLDRYPARLAALEAQLERTLQAAESQHTELQAKRDKLADKPGRADLAARYDEDLGVLSAQSGTARRVLATVWRTRAILSLRVHLACAARQRPELDHLPQPLDVDPEGLDDAAREYARASGEVRSFVKLLDAERAQIDAAVPRPSRDAQITPEHRESVEAERAEVDRLFGSLRERMDNLADTLEYLSDRFRTQKVVVGTQGAMDLGPEAGELLGEVSQALSQLEDLSAIGDKGLADVAVDGLVSDLAVLEEVGFDVDLQADANREVERLLASMARTGQLG